MNLWQVTADRGTICFGGRCRPASSPHGCNEPLRHSGRDAFWCPRRKWFSSEPCPFVHRLECMRFERMCGSV